MTVNNADIRRAISTIPPMPDVTPLIAVLKKQLTCYDKYTREGNEPQALENIKPMMLASARKIESIIGRSHIDAGGGD